MALYSSQSAFGCVGDMCHSLWQGDFTHNCKQVVNRLKIPQGLSTLLLQFFFGVVFFLALCEALFCSECF